MKTITSFLTKNSALTLLAAMFFMASCSKKTAYVSQHDKLAYEQNVAPSANLEAIAQIPSEIASVENNTEQAVAPMLNKKDIETKAVTGKTKKNAFASINNKLMDKAPKALKKAATKNLANITLLASAAKGDTKAMVEGKLRLAIMFVLIGLILSILAYIIPGFWWLGWIGYIFYVIGVIFFILWLLEYLGGI